MINNIERQEYEERIRSLERLNRVLTKENKELRKSLSTSQKLEKLFELSAKEADESEVDIWAFVHGIGWRLGYVDGTDFSWLDEQSGFSHSVDISLLGKFRRVTVDIKDPSEIWGEEES